MSRITIQNGRLVLRGGKVSTEQECCCDCEPCGACLTGCLSVTIDGFSGGEGCESCAAINGTYALSRGEGYRPRAYATVADQNGLGVGGVVELLLDYDAETGEYSVVGVEVIQGGIWYGDNNEIGGLTVEGGFVACGDTPVVEFYAERTAPPQPPSQGIGWVYVNVAQGFQSVGTGALMRVLWEPKNETEGEETWEATSVIVDSGGQRYRSQEQIRLRAGGLFAQFMLEEFSGLIEVDHAQPEIDEFQVETDAGVNAQFSATFALNDDLFDLYSAQGFDGRYWQISSLSITNAGTGYAVNDRIRYSIAGQHETAPPLFDNLQDWYDIAVVNSVGGNGEITGLGFPSPGPAESHFSTTGEIQYIVLAQAGEFFWPGPITEGTVIDGGTIWPDEPCKFARCDEVQCGEETACRRIEVSVGGGAAILRVTVGETEVITATASAPDPDDCTSLSFAEEDMTLPEGCTAGTIELSSGDCEDGPAVDSCCAPDNDACDPLCVDVLNIWGVSSVGCDPTDPCDGSVASSLCDLANGNRVEGVGFHQGGPDEILQTWSFGGGFVAGTFSIYYSRTILTDRLTLSESVTIEVGSEGCEWELPIIIYNAQSLAIDGNIFNPSSAQRTYTGFLSTTPKAARPYCLLDLGDSLVVSVDATGVDFGEERHAFTIIEQDVASGPNPPAFVGLDSLPGQQGPLTWVMSPRNCGNPLP